MTANNYASVEDFLAKPLSDGSIAVQLSEGALRLLLRVRASDALTVFFSPAVTDRQNKEPPFFAGVDLTRDLPTSFLAISDPMLELDPGLGLAWYAGSKAIRLQMILPQIIRSIAERIGASRIVLTGPSGGGFAALYYATRIPDSVAVAVNPQTEILRYERGAVERYARVCHGWSEGQDLKEALRPSVQNLPWHFHAGARAKGLLLQNASDWHVAKHTLPLIRALGGIDEAIDQDVGGLSFRFGDWGQGHAALPKECYRAVLAQIIQFGTEEFDNVLSPLIGRKTS